MIIYQLARLPVTAVQAPIRKLPKVVRLDFSQRFLKRVRETTVEAAPPVVLVESSPVVIPSVIIDYPKDLRPEPILNIPVFESTPQVQMSIWNRFMSFLRWRIF